MAQHYQESLSWNAHPEVGPSIYNSIAEEVEAYTFHGSKLQSVSLNSEAYQRLAAETGAGKRVINRVLGLTVKRHEDAAILMRFSTQG
jgi:hypothetical protein